MDKLDHLGWVVSRSYAIGDVRFAVRSTSHAFSAWLSETLAAYEVDDVEDYLYSIVVPDPPPAGKKPKEFCILYKGSSAVVRTLDPASLGRGLLTELDGHRLHDLDDAVYLTASVAEVGGEPVLIPSSLAPGLAKLGRRAAKLGLGVPGQFAIGVGFGSEGIVPLPATLDLPDDPIGSLTETLGWSGPDGLRFVAEPGDVRAVLVQTQEPAETALPVRKGYALANLTSWALNLQRTGGRGLQALGRFAERTPCYGSTWTDAAEAISRLAGALQEGS